LHIHAFSLLLFITLITWKFVSIWQRRRKPNPPCLQALARLRGAIPPESPTDLESVRHFADTFEDAIKKCGHRPRCHLCVQFAPEAHRIAELLDNSDSSRRLAARLSREMLALLGGTGADQQQSNAALPTPPHEPYPAELARTASMFQEARNCHVEKSNCVNVNGDCSSAVHDNSTHVLITQNHPGLSSRAGRNAD